MRILGGAWVPLLVVIICVTGVQLKIFKVTCSIDDFRCNNGKCIEASRRCDRVADCPDQEDERDCDCRPDEFRCEDNGYCIEERKRCDGIKHCSDGSDERLCPCGPDQWQCDHGSCIKRKFRCDGRVDCPTDRSDERNCMAYGSFICKTGTEIPEYLRCNRHYDCPSGDYSDEQNCPCGIHDFKCGNGHCIPATKHCDRTADCQDGSDERHCTYGTVCMAYEYECKSGMCVSAEARCNGTVECNDESDEQNCSCKRDQHSCQDGSCINIALLCNGRNDCSNGEDEYNCRTFGVIRWKCDDGEYVSAEKRCDGRSDCSDHSDEKNCDPKYLTKGSSCSSDQFTCPGSSSVCAVRCDNIPECEGGEDERNCDIACAHRCEAGGRCITANQVCDHYQDCPDGSDEINCNFCSEASDYRCDNGECLPLSIKCNGIPECTDSSDEKYCNYTMTSTNEVCGVDQFQCLSNQVCVDLHLQCDNNEDCLDGSDESNCPWFMTRASRSPAMATCQESEFTCYDGRCIPHPRRCDNIYDCTDFSDEQNCYNTGCSEDSWQCRDGQCIPTAGYCDSIQDCADNSDESDCSYTTQRSFVIATTNRLPTTTAYPFYPTERPTYPVNNGICTGDQWRCENGPCIDTNLRCNGHIDCPFDFSDEFDCPPNSPIALKMRSYPEDQTVRNVNAGGDVVFQCREEGPRRAAVKWHREGGIPIKQDSTDVGGRLEMFKVTEADSGVYICQAEAYAYYPESSVRVTLAVESAPVTVKPSFTSCKPAFEATCSNGQCIPRAAVCNGRVDCTDASDEENCHIKGMCEPNQFKCSNGKCVLKTWLCDSEDDCGDGSDEQNCGVREDSKCSPVEYACDSGQCIPKSFQCDGQTDCFDGSDESKCHPVRITNPPKPATITLNRGDELVLRCSAIGVPIPLISWRLNWGHVPAKCYATNDNGQGILTCPDMQVDDSGAYSCEALNSKGTTFAVPDAVVFVNKKDLCPTGYFNNEARSESECISCFCFGKTTQCRSADLYTYNMPTPLGEGGTMLLGIKATSSGDVTIDTQSISGQYYYQPLKNSGAVVTKYGGVSSWSNSLPYLSLPESYTGNQLKSYGGHIKYTLSAQTQAFGLDNTAATIIIKGKYGNLFHLNRSGGTRDINVEARLTPDNWFKTPDGSSRASREDIMMVLDDVEKILLRAELNNAGVNITDFAMESAEHINVGLGAASLVEECKCPNGYEGLSCQKCASGFTRKKTGPWLGDCEPEECPVGTYGDPSSSVPCKPCPCPLTDRRNQFARTCSLGQDGSVTCDCLPGYEGKHCEVCAAGYEGNPIVPGNTCQPKKSDNCNPIGTKSVRLPDECACKDNVQGRFCNQCKNDSFFLSEDFRHGCALCFCSGVSQQCMSSNFRRKTVGVQFNVPQIVDQVKIYNSAPSSLFGSVRYSAPKETELKPILDRGDLIVTDIDPSSRSNVFYWSMPAIFAGDKVTSYGGFLRYLLKNVVTSSSFKNNVADVQLISDNRLTFHYFGDYTSTHDGILNVTIPIFEKGWQRQDGKEVSREHFLLALADVKTILIKATYSPRVPELATPVSASIDIAEPDAYGPTAYHVEQCVCPIGYIGTSCEDCAPGYTRSSSGLYLQHCEPCDCNGKAKMCHPESGVCYNCGDNTIGDQCEQCKPGYERDPYNNCAENTTSISCSCDPRGSTGACNEFGQCLCKQNVEGDTCDRCRPATFGLDGNNPLGCLSCYCSGVTDDCHEGNHYTRVPIAAPVLGDNNGGYIITDLKSERVIKDQYLPLFDQSELIYNFDFKPDVQLYWSLPILPGNRVLSYGGSLSLRQKFTSDTDSLSERGVDVVLDGGEIAIYWDNPKQFESGVSYSYQVLLREEGWYRLNTVSPATRSDFMNVLRNLKRVLVRATLTRDIYSTTIADVSMDSATQSYDSLLPVAQGIEICMCPPGYTGTSCESCTSGFYKDPNGYCRECSCNGYDCQLDNTGRVFCNCPPPYTGYDCSTIGLVMELHPTIHDAEDDDILTRKVTFTCKYRAPEPLTIKFYHEGREQQPPKYFNDSALEKDGWHGEHVWHTVWDTRRQGEIYECHTFTERGFTLGVLTTSLPEPGGESSLTDETTRQPPQEPTVSVTIISPTIKIQEIGSSVNFTCQAQSRNTAARLQVQWIKSEGYLPLERTYIDRNTGVLQITNLQVSDSGKYICETTDGISTAQAIATLKVPGNAMTTPSVEVIPSVKEYYEGDYIQLECRVQGNPAPSITWQRTMNKPLPLSVENRADLLIIESAQVEDSGEYRCIASNTAGYAARTALVTVRPRVQSPPRGKLEVSNLSPTIDEGQSIVITCTGSTSDPPGSINWDRKDKASFLANMRSENGVLYVDYAEPNNQGVYICHSAHPDVAPVQIVLTVVAAQPEPEVYNITVSVDKLRIPTGGSGTIDCNAVGRQNLLIKWSKHQGQLGADSSQRGNTLVINNAQESDAGFYTCEGSINGPVSRPVAIVYVYVEIEKREAPRVEIWPAGEQPVPLGGQFEMICQVLAGIPTPDVTWSRGNGRSLSVHTQLQPYNKLKFEQIEVNDEGEYICNARNEAGMATASSVLKVRSPPEITITPKEYITINVGEAFKVECRANGYPQPEVSITFNNDVIVPPKLNHVTLNVPSASMRDEGYYTCNAVSAAGTVSEQFSVFVDRGDGGRDDEGKDDFEGSGYNPDTHDPNQDLEYATPTDLIAFEGQPETVIYCNKTGNVKWYRDDNMPLQRNAYQNETRLIILNVSKSDSGLYVCHIMDDYNEIQNTVLTSLMVVSPLQITLIPATQTVRPGQSPTVECRVSGDDIISIKWQPYNRIPSSRMETRGNQLIFHKIELEDAGEYECVAKSRYATSNSIAVVSVNGPRDTESQQLVRIEQPQQSFRVGDNVNVQCKATSAYVKIQWQRPGTNQYVPVVTYGDGVLLSIQSVTYADAGVYRCIGSDSQGRSAYDDFDLQVESGPSGASYPDISNLKVSEYSARLRDSVDLPCYHNLEQPVNYEWKKQFANLPTDLALNQPNLHLRSITEADAGTYVCRVSNSRTAAEAMAILTVKGVVPRFNGQSYIALPTLKDAFIKFEIEISFKPTDGYGLLLYNSNNQGREGDYIALYLTQAVPEFIMKTDSSTLTQIKYDRPLQLNTWHTIRISRAQSKVSMDVDNGAPIIAESPNQFAVLDLKQLLYIGGVPDYRQLPNEIPGSNGFIGCVGMLIVGRDEKNIVLNSIEQYQISECNSCAPNFCKNNGFCQEARNSRGYVCICATGYAGLDCDRLGEACRPGLCGPGKCTDTATSYKCACPVTHTGTHCEEKQTIEYPAFTGSAFMAFKAPNVSRALKISMNIMAANPVSDGIIMYCAESPNGYGGFTSLAVHGNRLELRYDLGKESQPVVLVSNKTLPPNEWTHVNIVRMGPTVSLKINTIDKYEKILPTPYSKKNLLLKTPIFVGGVDESITLNNHTAVSGGFNGCIKDFTIHGHTMDILSQTIQSANIQECTFALYPRGDIPEGENMVCQCRNGGECRSPSEPTSCSCPPGFRGQYCEQRVPYSIREERRVTDPCRLKPCRNGGTCRPDTSSKMNHTCDCPLGYAGVYCQMILDLYQSVSFNGNGYLELPVALLRYDDLKTDPAVIAFAVHSPYDGVLLYQKEAQSPPNYGDYILLRIERGVVVFDWDIGGGTSSLIINEVRVNDGERHQIIVKLMMDGVVELSVDGHVKVGYSTGFSNTINADSNIYVGGIPESMNQQAFPGFNGCIEQLELMLTGRGVHLGQTAVAGRNTQRCRDNQLY